jgi:hypothetical protein
VICNAGSRSVSKAQIEPMPTPLALASRRSIPPCRACQDLGHPRVGVELMLGQDVTGLVRSNGRSSGVRAVDRRRHERNVTARVIVAS